MKKSEAKAFGEFILDEAVKYQRQIAPEEIKLWFETFERVTFEDFKSAWVDHKRDDKLGAQFPKIPWLQKRLRTTGDGQAKRDWRCAAELDLERCNYPGAVSESVHGGGPYYCCPHFRLFQSELTKQAVAEASRQIIEESKSYKPPTTYDELYEMNDARRAAATRKREVDAKRRTNDQLPAARVGESFVMQEDIDRANAAAALAAQEAV